jgi:co-chaperonin GroES (HSP10)
MPVIEYLKDYESDEKGKQGIVTWSLANKIEKEGIAVIVGEDSNRDTQSRTSTVNEMAKVPDSSSTVSEIKDYLDMNGTSYPSNTRKKELLKIVTQTKNKGE